MSRSPIRVGVMARIVREDGKVLMVKRKFSPNKGQWAYPGGVCNHDKETLLEACSREAFEETGLTIIPGDIRHVYLEEYCDMAGTSKWLGVCIIFDCQILKGEFLSEEVEEAKIATEADDHEWFASPPEDSVHAFEESFWFAQTLVEE